MNTYTKLKLHLEEHMYTRGAHKGEAPADQWRRGKSHFRVIARPSWAGHGTEATNAMVVRMHNTDILTAYEDGSIMVSTGGWWTSTTRHNLNEALWKFGTRLYVSGRKVFGMSQPTITRAGGPTWLFYDGIRFDADSEMRSPPMPFERRRADKDERAEFRTDVAESGFKDAFPILYQSVGIPTNPWLNLDMHKLVRDPVHTNMWASVIGLVKYPTYLHRRDNSAKYEDWRSAWKVLMAECTKNMTETIRTDVLYLP